MVNLEHISTFETVRTILDILFTMFIFMGTAFIISILVDKFNLSTKKPYKKFKLAIRLFIISFFLAIPYFIMKEQELNTIKHYAESGEYTVYIDNKQVNPNELDFYKYNIKIDTENKRFTLTDGYGRIIN